MARIYLSFSRTDADDAADNLSTKLNQANHIVWGHRDEVRTSAVWQQHIDTTLAHAHAVVILITPAGVQSEQMRYEWAAAQRLGKPIWGVEILPTEIPEALRSVPHFAATDRELYQDMLMQLTQALSELDLALTADDRITRSIPLDVIEYVGTAIRNYSRALRDRYEYSIYAEPSEPYKGLYAYEMGDAKIFFGRDTDTRQLYRTVLKDRFSVLHARSGAGKTSLLNAGLMPLLIRSGYLPVYARVHNNPVEAVKRALTAAAPHKAPPEFSDLSLHQCLRIADDALSGESRELVVILDQFEEFYVRFPIRDQRTPIINALADCIDDWTLRARFLVSLRKDYFSDLADFQDWLLSPFENNLRLRSLTREQAMHAITGPIAAVAPAISYENALLDEMLSDLERGGMELPHLQIVCSQLYADLPPDRHVITCDDYQRMGKAQGILGNYLVNTLDDFSPENRDLAQRLLIELVSSQSTKRILSREELIAAAHAPQDQADRVLESLLSARLLRRDKESHEGQVLYEMAHEYLVDEISNWFDSAITSRKQIQELLQRAVMDWQVHDILMSLDILQRISQERENLGDLSDDALTCILLSSIQERCEVRWWMTHYADRALSLLAPIIHQRPTHRLRRQIIVSLRYLEADAVPFLIDLADRPDENLRKVISQVLENIGTPQALVAAQHIWAKEEGVAPSKESTSEMVAVVTDDTPVDITVPIAPAEERIPELEPEPEPDVAQVDANLTSPFTVLRLEAVDLLARQGGDEAVAALVDCLQDPSLFVRKASAQALGKIGDYSVVPALQRAQNDESSSVRRAAAEALEYIESSKMPRDEYPDFDAARSQERRELLDSLAHRQQTEPAIPPPGDVPGYEAGHESESEYMPYAVYSMSRQPIPPAELPPAQKQREVEAHEQRRRRLMQAANPKVWQQRVLEAYAREGFRVEQATINNVITLLSHLPNFSRRARAVEELRRTGSPAIPGLLAYLQYPQRIVRQSVVKILNKIQWQPLDIRSRVIYLMAAGQWDQCVALGPAAVPVLIELLDTESDVILRDTFFALKQLRDPAAVPALIEQLADTTPLWIKLDETSADQLAADVLESIGTREAIRAVQRWRQVQTG
ncbi:MAG: HEAT repeat domain-containing protein [Anaerolineae bacterium]|nr:HEAT repeat domain-containing protein [Anaerolineae bacterium]